MALMRRPIRRFARVRGKNPLGDQLRELHDPHADEISHAPRERHRAHIIHSNNFEHEFVRELDVLGDTELGSGRRNIFHAAGNFSSLMRPDQTDPFRFAPACPIFVQRSILILSQRTVPRLLSSIYHPTIGIQSCLVCIGNETEFRLRLPVTHQQPRRTKAEDRRARSAQASGTRPGVDDGLRGLGRTDRSAGGNVSLRQPRARQGGTDTGLGPSRSRPISNSAHLELGPCRSPTHGPR